jgi:hypothetical protein
MMEFVDWADEIPNIWKNEKCSKAPTSLLVLLSIEGYEAAMTLTQF